MHLATSVRRAISSVLPSVRLNLVANRSVEVIDADGPLFGELAQEIGDINAARSAAWRSDNLKLVLEKESIPARQTSSGDVSWARPDGGGVTPAARALRLLLHFMSVS
jgi:hypothetical protein